MTPRPPLGYDGTLPAAYTQAASSGSHWLIIPGDDAGVDDPTLPVLMYCPGASSSADQAANSSGVTGLLREIVRQMQRPMIVAQTGNTWGNATGLAATENAVTVAGTDLGNDTSRVLLIGGSMGGATMATHARAHPTEVEAMAGLGPVSDLTDIVDNNRGGHATGVNGAFGGWSEETYGALFNPVTIAAAGGYDGIRYRVWYAQGDPICVAPTIESMIASIPGASGATFPDGAHNSEIHTLLAPELVAFLEGPDSDTVVSVDSAGRNVTTFYRSGTFTAPSYPVTLPRVLIVGGGGGAGFTIGISNSAGCGGGGGVSELTNVVIEGPTAVTVGRGGIVSTYAGADANQGGQGESSAFGATTVAGGGAGGGTGNDAISPGNLDGTNGASGGGGALGAVLGTAGAGSSGGDGSTGVYWSPSSYYGGYGGGAGGDAIASPSNGVPPTAGPGIVVDIYGSPFTAGEGGSSAGETVPNTGQGGSNAGRNTTPFAGSAGRVVIVEGDALEPGPNPEPSLLSAASGGTLVAAAGGTLIGA